MVERIFLPPPQVRFVIHKSFVTFFSLTSSSSRITPGTDWWNRWARSTKTIFSAPFARLSPGVNLITATRYS